MNNNNNIGVALELASAGIAIFPVAISQDQQDSLQKKPACKWKDDASTADERIRDWWQARPSFVPGINLSRSGLFVVDLDRHQGGPDGIKAFRALRGDNPMPTAVPVTVTATGGLHLFFNNKEGLTNARGNLPTAGIDVRGVGGFVVAPGSTWEGFAWRSHPKRPRLVDIYPNLPALPDWLLQVIRPPELSPRPQTTLKVGNADRAIAGLIRTIAGAREGERNSKAFWGGVPLR
jgi:Bifunctional DNA primase/polymerase, N-terminal